MNKEKFKKDENYREIYLFNCLNSIKMNSRDFNEVHNELNNLYEDLIKELIKMYPYCPYCNYCNKGILEVKEALKIGSYDIICNNCGATWIDEDDISEII